MREDVAFQRRGSDASGMAVPTRPCQRTRAHDRHEDTPLFSLLVVVQRQAVFWQDRLTALKAGAIATGGR